MDIVNVEINFCNLFNFSCTTYVNIAMNIQTQLTYSHVPTLVLFVVSLKIVSAQMLWSSVPLLCISAFGEHRWRKLAVSVLCLSALKTKSGDCVSCENFRSDPGFFSKYSGFLPL